MLVFLLQNTFSQVNTDSLKQTLVNEIHDTVFVLNCLDITWNEMYTNVDTSVVYAIKAIDKAIDINDPLLLADSYNALGVSYIVKAKYYESLIELQNGIAICEDLINENPEVNKYKRKALAIYANIGNIYYYQSNYDDCIENYLKALKLSEEIGFKKGIAVSCSNLAAAYKDILNYDKALEYNYRSLSIANESGDRFSVTQSLNNLGSVYFSIPDYDSAYIYFKKCQVLNEQDSNEFALISTYVNIADVLRETGKYDSALYYFNKSLALSKKLNSNDGLINDYYMIGQLYEKTGEYDNAIKNYDSCIIHARKGESLRFLQLANKGLSESYKQKGDYKKALEHKVISSTIRDSIFNEERDARIADMEAKYRTEKKEEEIRLLQEKNKLHEAEARTSRIIFISVIVILVLIVILIVIAYRSYKHKQLAEKRHIQKEAERKVLNAVIDTEYKERKRFAEDLHDGLGVLLSTLRLYINEIVDSTSDEQKKLIDQSNAMLDDAIANARNISNNIMPAALKNNGLVAAIKSYSDKINSTGNLKIKVDTSNLQKSYGTTIELTVFRVITEMINNTLKHGDASEVNITMLQEQSKLQIHYNDNGVGFDFEKTIKSNKKGLGLDNIVSRVISIGGKCNMNSSPGNGFEAIIEIELENQ